MHGYGEPRFAFLGGALCLDFCNTVDWHVGPAPSDRLREYRDLLVWAVQGGVVTPEGADALAAAARQDPAAAERALGFARDLREAVFRVFLARVRGGDPHPADLERLNQALSPALARVRLEAIPGGFAWAWDFRPDDLAFPAWPVARSAAELLTSPELDRVRLCSDEACGWLFLDRSRNRSRRWCSMEDCGNRAKARRFYRRRRARGAPDAGTGER